MAKKNPYVFTIGFDETQPSDSVLDLSPQEKEMDESITQNIMAAMDTFRRN